MHQLLCGMLWKCLLCHPDLRPSAKANQRYHFTKCQTITRKGFPPWMLFKPLRILHLEIYLMSPSINVYYRQPIKSNTVFQWVPPNKYYSQILLVIQKLLMCCTEGGWCWTTYPRSPGASGKSLGWWDSIPPAGGDWPRGEEEREYELGRYKVSQFSVF